VLDGAGNAAATLPASEVQAVTGGYRIHLNGTGQTMSPWFAVSATPPQPASIIASPNPIVVTSGSTGQTTIAWNAPGYAAVEVHSGSPDGPLVISAGSSGSVLTGPGVTRGMRFYLVDPATQTELAMVTVLLDIHRIRVPHPPKRVKSPLGQTGGDLAPDNLAEPY
jgi:hypothetical protein